MMSIDKRQQVRTQGKYLTEVPDIDIKSKKLNSSEPKSKHKKSSDTDVKIKSPGLHWHGDESAPHFPQLETPTPAKIISEPGFHVLSNTENGESRIYYDPNFIPEDQGHMLFRQLRRNVQWSNKKVVIHGQEFRQPRLVSWYGPLPYEYSGVTLAPQEMPAIILKIKQNVELSLKKHNINIELNSVLLNLYRNGKDSVAWHSDDESSMGICPTIASVSLGEMRRFEMRRRTLDYNSKADAEYVVHLAHGSLIVMDGVMQQDWLHRVPKEYHDRDERINLTFRTVFPIESVSRPFSSRGRDVQTKELTSVESPRASQQSFQYEENNFPSLNAPDSLQPKPQRDWSSRSRQKDASDNRATVTHSEELVETEDNAEQCKENDLHAEVVASKSLSLTEISAVDQPEENAVPQNSNDCNTALHVTNSMSSTSQDRCKEWIEQSDSCTNGDVEEIRESGYSEQQVPMSKLNVYVREFVPRQQRAKEHSVEPYANNEAAVNYKSNRQRHSLSNRDSARSSFRGRNRNYVTNSGQYEGAEKSSVYSKKTKKPDMQSWPLGGSTKDMSISEDSPMFKQEGKKLADIYGYVKSSWNEIPFTARDKAELRTLLLIIEEMGPLSFNVMKAIANRMITIVDYAERQEYFAPPYPIKNRTYYYKK